ncbi:MAG: lytic transglycosylase domain-containing protein, partial [Candidatus Kapaibacterium sp.]
LKFLSVAESALYQAQSGKGAVGLWQFIPETAQHYGLRVDSFVDERKDIAKSTAAAIRLLVDNKQRFGSWALSAAAYNMGEAATQDDLTFQNGHSFYDLFLNEETSRYVFRIIALKEIMTHPDRYGFFLTRNDYYAPTPAATVMVSDEITNLAQWAESKGTTYKDVKLLNPWILKRNLPKPSGAPYAIAIPAKEGR